MGSYNKLFKFLIGSYKVLLRIFMPCISSSKEKEQSSEIYWLSVEFFCLRKLLLGINWLSVKLKRCRTGKCQKSIHMNEIYSLIFWWKIICHSYKLFPSNNLPVKYRAQIAKVCRGFDPQSYFLVAAKVQNHS